MMSTLAFLYQNMVELQFGHLCWLTCPVEIIIRSGMQGDVMTRKDV